MAKWSSESVSKGFIIIAGFGYNAILKLKGVKGNVIPYAMKNRFYIQSSNIKYRFFTPSAINMLNCANMKEATKDHNLLLNSCKRMKL